MNKGTVILSHGLESGPNATKVSRMAALAEGAGWRSERPDYSDLSAPQGRLEHLLERCAANAGRSLVLVGSSMGAYISALASLRVPVNGLFLLAPPVALPNAQTFDLAAPRSVIVHGWADELIPAPLVCSYAQVRGIELLMVDDGHRLSASLDRICAHFQLFLKECASP